MTCNCPCTCPPKVGDLIRYKLDPDSRMPDVRVNGALDLTLAYLGMEYVIYTWQDRNGAGVRGEVCMSRADFERKIERVPGQ